jgi:hypothetical protein
MAGFGKENVAAPTAPALANKTSRREMAMDSSQFLLLRPRRSRGRSSQPNFGRPVKFDPDADALSRDSARTRYIAATGSIGAKCRVGS